MTTMTTEGKIDTTPETQTGGPSDGNGEKFRHIIDGRENGCPPNLDMDRFIDIVIEKEIEVTALCGYKYVPRQRGEGIPACDNCLDIAAAMQGLGTD